MEKLSTPLIKRLDLAAAVVAESASIRNLLPAEPAWDRILEHQIEIAGALANQLRAGFRPSSQVEIAARKPAHGVRPIPYWGLLERVAYRALTTVAFAGQEPLDRSSHAYIEFTTAPGRYARDRQEEHTSERGFDLLFFLTDTPVNYVVKSDLTAFYQFVDHAILAEEMLLAGVDFELVEAIAQLLAEVQGRTFGLPQLFEASDMLSELYADRIERDLLRGGFAVWRFNDDFRIACDTYADALGAIEALDAAARQVGLVLSESKTVTVGFLNYIFEVYDLSPSEAGESLNVDNVEDLVGDYTDDFGEEDSAGALDVIRNAQVKPSDVEPELSDEDWVDLRNLRVADVRLLKRAFNGLSMAADTGAIADVVRLLIYAPSLTPNLFRYLQKVGENLDHEDRAWSELVATVDALATGVALNAWQKLWLVELVRELGLLDERNSESVAVRHRVSWIEGLRHDTTSDALRATATRALAPVGTLTVPAIIAEAEMTSDALLHIYASAALECAGSLRGQEKVAAERAIRAWARTSKVHTCLLQDV